MATLYVDGSALLRIVFGEPGERISLRRKTVAVSSKIVEVECFRALDRARLEGHLNDAETAKKSKEVSDFLKRLHLVPVSNEVISIARSPFTANVRALDAIHVASAQWILPSTKELEFWTHDVRQATAALSRGLDVRGVAL